MQYQHHLARTILCIVAATLVVGCQPAHPEQKPFLVPGADSVRVSHFVGTPLSGPTSQTLTSLKASDALLVDVQFIGLEKMPAQVGQQLAVKARLIVAMPRDTPLIPASRLMREARWVDLHQPGDLEGMISSTAGRSAVIAQPNGAVPPGVTAAFDLSESTSLLDPTASAAAHRRLGVLVYRPPATGPLQLGLVVEDLAEPPTDKTDLDVTPPGPGTTAAPRPPLGKGAREPVRKIAAPVSEVPPEFQREMAIVDLPGGKPTVGAAAIIVPIHFSGTDTTAIAAVISIHPAANAPANIAALARCTQDIQHSADDVANRPESLTVLSPGWSRYRVALDALSQESRRRSALVYLATQTGANLCRDVALATDQASLDRLSAAVRRAVAAPSTQPAPDSDALGWTLDRTTFQMLGAELGESKLPPELMAVLVACAGEVGRDSGSVEEVSKSLATRFDFDNRLLAENLIFLEDSSLAARVRAFDWLAARGKAPPGYAPDGAPNDRRDALEPLAAAPAAGGTK